MHGGTFPPRAYFSDEKHHYGAENGLFRLQPHHVSMFFIAMEVLFRLAHTLVMNNIIMVQKMDYSGCSLIM
ncbi:hypothetical protein [Paenibacillus sp. Soil787]|uniref:hypothetical protein n=1 Tax=Paenibacillus sp. Soil787 TaxID=1736411 RepID=UPI0007028D47|nr:hypothetical protein [Paenibacillus sp. Soil787]KRF23131.1 hypothetical protein ASG93_29595 [Paenibacillus sp. Soil787]